MRTAFGILLLVSAASAQTHLHGPEPVEAPTDLGKLPAPRHIDGIGHSHIGITTKSAEAQQWFDQGLATLHCFWYTKRCGPLNRRSGSIRIARCVTGAFRGRWI